jgi:molybdopterin/thiamine biosynthesis adenylyltransferase/nitroreductase
MDKTSLLNKIKEFGLNTKEEYMAEAFSRNIGLLTQAEQDKLANAKIAIPGMGGVGGVHLITLVRTGVCRFHLADFDTFEPANINRQFGARVPDFGRPKMEVMKEQALSINPYLEIKEFPEGINNTNIDDFLNGVEVVLDGLDFFAFDARRLLFNRAREKGIYVITAGPLGFSSALLVFAPHDGMSFDEYFNIIEGMSPQDQYLAFALGLAPRATHIKYIDLSKVDLESKAGPSLNIACQICSGTAATEAVRIILNKGRIKPAPHFFQFDPYVQKYRKGKLYMGNRNPIQRIKMYVVKKILAKKKKNTVPAFPSPPKLLIKNDAIPEEVIRYLVTMGTWACSVDNCQPWDFIWDGNILSLLKDPDRTGFFYDVNHESTYITFGAVIENIRIAATHYGLKTDMNLFPSRENQNIIAEIKFLHTDIDTDPLYPFIMDRCVNRKPYMKKKIEADVIQKLKDVVSETPGADMIWIDGKDDKRVMRNITYNADRILFEDKRLHEGLFRWIRIKKEDASKKDGMNLNVLELSWFQKQAFPILANWRVLSWLNKIGMSRAPGINSIILLKQSPAYCLLTMNNRSPSAYINGGRMLERFWIKANALGLSLQPMAGFIFLLNHLNHDGALQFSKNHRASIQNMYKEIEKILREQKNRVPTMFFRIGYATRPTTRTPRRPVDEIFQPVRLGDS